MQQVKQALRKTASKAKKVVRSVAKAVTKTVKKVCTTAKRIQKATVSFVKNVDWKKVVAGAAVAVAIAGGTAVMFNQTANAGSSVAGNYEVRQAVDVGTDTVLDTVQAVSRGEDVNAKTIGRDLLTNMLMAGAQAAGGNGKNGIADGSGKIKQGSGNHNRIEHISKEEGTFIIKDWSDYPDDYIPVPNKDKVWKLLKGDEYDKARTAAHRKYVTSWWNKIQDELKE